MNDLVQFLSDLTGKAIDIAPQAIASLVAMKAASIAMWTAVMWWCAGITVVLVVLAVWNGCEGNDGLAMVFGVIACISLVFAVVGLIEGPLTEPIFNAAPEVYVLRDLIN